MVVNVGKHTFVNRQGCSVIDYLLCKNDMFCNIDVFEIEDPNIVSDHCLMSVNFVFDNLFETMTDCRTEKKQFDCSKFKYAGNPS